MAAACFGGVRDFTPCEAYTAYRTQIGNLRAVATGDEVTFVLAPADVDHAHAAGG